MAIKMVEKRGRTESTVWTHIVIMKPVISLQIILTYFKQKEMLL
jgi:hypothetical protein